jgi:hypothetical protein
LSRTVQLIILFLLQGVRVYHPASVRAILDRGSVAGATLRDTDIALAAGDVLDALFSHATEWTADVYQIGVSHLGHQGARVVYGNFGTSYRAVVAELLIWHPLDLGELATSRVAGWRLAKEQGLIRFASGLLSGVAYTSADLRAFTIDIISSIPEDDSGGDPSHFVSYTMDTLVRMATSVCWYGAANLRGSVEANTDYFAAKSLWYVLLERMLRADRLGSLRLDDQREGARLVMEVASYPFGPTAGVLGSGLAEAPNVVAMSLDRQGDPLPFRGKLNDGVYSKHMRIAITRALASADEDMRLTIFSAAGPYANVEAFFTSFIPVRDAFELVQSDGLTCLLLYLLNAWKAGNYEQNGSLRTQLAAFRASGRADTLHPMEVIVMDSLHDVLGMDVAGSDSSNVSGERTGE